MPTLPPWLLGVDFSCAPSARKPIMVAWGRRIGQVVKLDRLDALPTLAAFEQLLSPSHPRTAEGWVGAFDFPFGLPRPFVEALAIDGANAATLIAHLWQRCGNRQGFQTLIDTWGRQWGQDTRPATLPHRRTDRAVPGVSSTSPLQTRYVPVGKMYFEGLARLVQAGVTLPLIADGRPEVIAFEAYPGLLATEVLGRQSYKNDQGPHADPARLLQRLSLIDALEQGRTRLGLRLKLSTAQREHLAGDPQGDRLDAVLCLLQAAWAHERREAGDDRWGLPDDIDPVEGWILTA